MPSFQSRPCKYRPAAAACCKPIAITNTLASGTVPSLRSCYEHLTDFPIRTFVATFNGVTIVAVKHLGTMCYSRLAEADRPVRHLLQSAIATPTNHRANEKPAHSHVPDSVPFWAEHARENRFIVVFGCDQHNAIPAGAMVAGNGSSRLYGMCLTKREYTSIQRGLAIRCLQSS